MGTETKTGGIIEMRQEEVIKDPRYSVVIFDFHGTLTDHQLRSIKAIHDAGHKAFGIHLSKEFYQDSLTRPSHQSGKGMTNKDFFEAKFANEDVEKVSTFLESYKASMDSLYIPIPGMKRVIKTILRSNVNVSILTNGSNRQAIQQELIKWGLPQLAENLYSSHITGVRKPDPYTIQHIFNDYEAAGKPIDKAQTLLIGDYVDDIQTAHNIGIDSLLIVRGNGWEEMKVKSPKPTYIVTHALDVLRVMEGNYPKFTGNTYAIKPLLWPAENWGKLNNVTTNSSDIIRQP